IDVAAAVVELLDADFAGGSGDCTVITAPGETRVTLAGALYESFSSWPAAGWTGGGSASGQLTVDGSLVATNELHAAPRSLEFRASFGAEANQHIGFGQNLVLAAGETWALFSRLSATNGLYASVNNNGTVTDTPIPGDWSGMHKFRIDWTSTGVTFWIDDDVVHTAVVSISSSRTMRPVISDAAAGGAAINVDWMRMGPYAPSCVFTSRVFDGGSTIDWDQFAGTFHLPPQTAIVFETQSGDSADPSTWSAWLPVNGTTVASATSRYIRYRALLTTLDPLGAPDLFAVTINPADTVIVISDSGVIEGNSGSRSATFTVSLLKAMDVPVTVDYRTAAGSAVSPEDYAAVAGSLTFPAGMTWQTITVPVHGDLLNEDDEVFYVNLSNATNGVIADPQGSSSVSNDDPLPAVSISDSSVVEGDSGTQFMVFDVSLSAASGRVVTVRYGTTNGTATSTDDFFAKTGTVTFQPGVTSMKVSIQIKTETKFEDDESFQVSLNTPGNCVIGDGDATGTIINNDAVPSLSVADVTIVEGHLGTKNAVFTVRMSNSCAQTVTVNYGTVGGTALAPADFLLTSGTLTFTSGQVSKTVWVVINGDTTAEPNETFDFVLTNPTGGATLDRATATGTITNDD
ncbi:MAG TPA: Calx-beta domain-containing protein, partial [Thermoanaerobaculia bacterium]|nr:Calx-beta domain-containing protein [Thermoanaerobaculia bacterium]